LHNIGDAAVLALVVAGAVFLVFLVAHVAGNLLLWRARAYHWVDGDVRDGGSHWTAR
jgi:hypothetical protein